MSPNFLSKLVKSSPAQHVRDGTRRGRTPSPASSNRSRKLSFAAVPSIIINSGTGSNTTRSNTPDSTNRVNVTIIPPSPLVSSEDVTQQRGYESDRRAAKRSGSVGDRGSADERRPTLISASSPAPPLPDDMENTPTTARPSNPNGSNKNKNSLTNSHTPFPSNGSLGEHGAPSSSSSALELPSAVRRQSSNKSLKSASQSQAQSVPTRSATSPPAIVARNSSEEGTADALSMSPIVESPTDLTFDDSVRNSVTSTATSRNADIDAASVHSSGGTAAPPNTPATASILPNASNTSSRTITNTNAGALRPPVAPKKKRSWRRGSTPSRKPTGLAGALAASGMAMANVSTAVPQLTLPSMQKAINGMDTGQQHRKFAATSPRSGSSTNLPTPSTIRTKSSFKSRSRRPSTANSGSVQGENNSDVYGDDRSYSGLDGSSSDDDSGSSDDLMDLDFGDDDIPVTGFAVASNKRNADFHELFPNIPEGDYLIEDYGCALQREILIQGRIYISENHVCFHSNIFGWVTDLSIPIFEVTALEKKMTAFVIPNAIQVTTRQAKYTFASFLSRDTTFDVIFNIWRLAKPEDSATFTASATGSGRGSLEGGRMGMDEVREGPVGLAPKTAAVPLRKATLCACGQNGTHFSETALETVLPGTPERIHNLMFASGFMKDFMKDNQKLLDIQISDWSPTSPGSKLLTRNMSYIKPLSASIGPKQTKCEIRDETTHCDFDDYVVMLTTTRTPDVPSGGVFSVKTRTCIMWASAISTKVIVTTQLEWTGRSFIKTIIERSAIEGQKSYQADLDLAMRAYIRQHQSEFIPQGIDPAVVAPPVADTVGVVEPVTTAKPSEGLLDAEERKQREHERNQRGLQWALDTFEGASQVAKQSTRGAIELIKETWEQSTSTSICIFIIIVLVFSNLWTLMKVGSREDVGRRKDLRKTEVREKWIQGVVTALFEEMAAGKGPPFPVGSTTTPPGVTPASPTRVELREEVSKIQKTLDGVEERVRSIRNSLNELD